jgi:hypothetical protein
MANFKEILTKVKPSKRTLAIIAAIIALVLGSQSGITVDELIQSADKFVPIINTIVDAVSESSAATAASGNGTAVVIP